MMARRPAETTIPPLLVWGELAEIDRLQRQREQLLARIAALPRFSHRRLELEYRLRGLTAHQLMLQTKIGDRR